MATTFKNPGVILTRPTFDEFMFAVQEAYGEGFGPKHEASVREIYAEMRDRPRNAVANDRLTIEWKPLPPCSECGHVGRIVNITMDPAPGY